jgi:putative NADPH-quinone reductase
MKRITIIQGHPDPDGRHFGHALAQAYREGAEAAGHEVRLVEVAKLDFPLLRSQQDFDHGSPPDALRPAQEAIAWADHLVILYPLWLGDLPALLKGFLEQVLRPEFAFTKTSPDRPAHKRLTGRSARVVVTMGMPAFAYRWFYRAHSLKNLERNILKFCGIGPVRSSLIGMVETGDGRRRAKWLMKMRALGKAGK